MRALCIFTLSIVFFSCFVDCGMADDSALDLFKKRITPILRSPKASSCSECHLSGVDLKNYIGKTQVDTFASLRNAGLINLERPDDSKLLALIKREPENASPVSRQARAEEYTAFRAWIRAAVKDPVLAQAKTDSDQLGPSVPVEVIRHGRQQRVIASFVENIWSEMGRCVSCHSPELNRQKIGRNGNTKEDVDAISWVVPRNPAATLEKLIETGNIETDAPEESLVLTKPVGLEEHGGGPKFALGSRTDKNFRRFLVDYAAVVNGKYEEVDQLPAESPIILQPTRQHLRITNLPAGLDKNLLRVDLYRWSGDAWSESPWATADNPIAGKQHRWQSMISASAPRGSERAKKLHPEHPIPGGRYLIKIYIDRKNVAKKDRDFEFAKKDFFAEVEIDGPWAQGWREPKIIKAPLRD